MISNNDDNDNVNAILGDVERLLAETALVAPVTPAPEADDKLIDLDTDGGVS